MKRHLGSQTLGLLFNTFQDHGPCHCSTEDNWKLAHTINPHFAIGGTVHMLCGWQVIINSTLHYQLFCLQPWHQIGKYRIQTILWMLMQHLPLLRLYLREKAGERRPRASQALMLGFRCPSTSRGVPAFSLSPAPAHTPREPAALALLLSAPDGGCCRGVPAPGAAIASPP